MESELFQLENLRCEIIRSSGKKRLSIRVTPDNRLIINAPLKAQKTAIISFIKSCNDWISSEMVNNKKKYPGFSMPEGKNGDTLFYLGEKVKLIIEPTKKEKPLLMNNQLFVFRPENDKSKILQQIDNWYKHNATIIITERVEYFRKKADVSVNTVRIKKLTSRWGSCSSLGNLNFNWKLIMAPIQVVDYVVVHELAHLVHPDHSKHFWGYVKELMPDYKPRKKWLKTNGSLLDLQ